MIKKIFITLLFSLFFLLNIPTVLADTKFAGDECRPGDTCSPPSKYSCQQYDSKTYLCTSRILGAGDVCNSGDPGGICASGYDCQFDSDADQYLCQKSTTISTTFGRIKPPDILRGFLKKNPTGAGGISQFLSNGVTLIYSIAGIVLVAMLLWGAFEWMTSGGDKEKLSSAQKRIINAIIGIILFALAFAIIRVLGQFTGFTFFAGT